MNSLNIALFVPRSLCHVVLGAFTSLWYLPVDVLLGSFDITCLAVNAAVFLMLVARIDKKKKKEKEEGDATHFCALIWNRTPWGFDSSSTYSYTPAGQKRFSRPLNGG